MTRTEAIDAIAANLPRLGEEELATLVKVTRTWAQPASEFALTDAERAAVERSREDFKAGRTLTLDEAEARTDAVLATNRQGTHQIQRLGDQGQHERGIVD